MTKVYECQNCGTLHAEDSMNPIEDISVRVAPGETMPAGECMDCGAVCHEWEPAPTPDMVLAEDSGAHNTFYIQEHRESAELDELNCRTINAALAFVREMASLTTPEDEVADDLEPGESLEESLDDFMVNIDSDRLFEEYSVFMEMVRNARKILKGETNV